MTTEAAYWIALAHLPRWGHLKINKLIVKFFHEEKITIEEFFNLPEMAWSANYGLEAGEVADLQKAKAELPNNAFLAENIINQGFELIPIISPEYSKILKGNLKASHSPAVLYIKGNKQILKERSIAIVGSRAASPVALDFTDNIAKLASKNFKVVVSGFAKGVDKQALDSALNYKGQSIIVLPQGIATFGSGFKTYYKQIQEGDVLVLSTFFPKAPWKTELAMARNPIIYGLAEEIYVAESSEKGGTWSGVIDGLRKGRKIFVRQPEVGENNANGLLIQKGGISVDFEGQVLNDAIEQEVVNIRLIKPLEEVNIDNKVLSILNGTPLSAMDIIQKLNLDWTSKKLTAHLNKMSAVQVVKNGRLNQYILRGQQPSAQQSLF